MDMRRTQNGFSLIELMIIVVVIGILAATSLPWLRGYISNSYLSTTSIDIVSGIQYARSEAIRRNNRVGICVSADSATCSGTNTWHTGWVVFNDANENGSLDAGPDEQVLRIGAAVTDPGVQVLGGGTVNTMISFTGLGSPQSALGGTQAGDILVCDQRSSTEGVGRAVQISPSGRIKTSAEPADIVNCPAPTP